MVIPAAFEFPNYYSPFNTNTSILKRRSLTEHTTAVPHLHRIAAIIYQGGNSSHQQYPIDLLYAARYRARKEASQAEADTFGRYTTSLSKPAAHGCRHVTRRTQI